MVDLLMIKIKLDIGDIIQGYLKAFEDIINNNELMLIGNDYINNMLKILEKSEKKFWKFYIFVGVKNINIELDFKYKIL